VKESREHPRLRAIGEDQAQVGHDQRRKCNRPGLTISLAPMHGDREDDQDDEHNTRALEQAELQAAGTEGRVGGTARRPSHQVGLARIGLEDRQAGWVED
jgi:hypothetical protein